ncbi:MAG: hypothetical protein OXF79_01855 [Chloroflexi bacterium]|nr:hypothetical protein [Chloroflexota bacterium]
MTMPIPIARNGRHQIGDCATAISVQEITDHERVSVGIAGDIQVVFSFHGNGADKGELRVPISRDALAEADLDGKIG